MILRLLSRSSTRQRRNSSTSGRDCVRPTAMYGWLGYKPAIDTDILVERTAELTENCLNRGCKVDVKHVLELWNNLKSIKENISKSKADMKQSFVMLREKNNGDNNGKAELLDKIKSLKSLVKSMELVSRTTEREFYDAAALIPNWTSPTTPVGNELLVRVLESYRDPESEHPEAGRNHKRFLPAMRLMRLDNLSHLGEYKTCYLNGDLALLENALTQFGIASVVRAGFTLLSVPTLARGLVVEGCGFPVHTSRTQTFRLDAARHGDLYLCGTGEVPLAGFFFNAEIDLATLPIRVATSSTCYRAEVPSTAEAGGLYRLPQFNKVEMFGVTANETGTESRQLMEEFIEIQKGIYKELELPFRVLEMPTYELGLPAYRKVDIEVWMPGRQGFGEVSSCSNCTDFQARRLRTRYVGNLVASMEERRRSVAYCHTVNGTAVATSRCVLAIAENYRSGARTITVPPPLLPYMMGRTEITTDHSLKHIKYHKTTARDMYSKDSADTN